jgi:peptidoglycan hydrolase CwlO-like protein
MRRMNSWTAKRNSLLRKIKKHVKVKNAYAQEVEKNENLTKELSMCHDSITNLRNENASLNAKIDKLSKSISSLRTENASLISKAKDLNVCNDSISCLEMRMPCYMLR